MKIKNILLTVACISTLAACGGNGDYTPKPQAYLRIDMPEHSYWLVDSLCSHPGDTLVFGTDTSIVITGSCKTFPFTFEGKPALSVGKDNKPNWSTIMEKAIMKWIQNKAKPDYMDFVKGILGELKGMGKKTVKMLEEYDETGKGAQVENAIHAAINKFYSEYSEHLEKYA